MMKEKPNIILVVLDSLRHDRLSATGYDQNITPNLDALVERGMLFRNAISTGSWTVPAHASMFTGKLPGEHAAHARSKQLVADSKQTLAGRLSTIGYETVGVSANPWLREKYGFTAGFDTFKTLTPDLPFDYAGDPADEQWNDDWSSFYQYGKWILEGDPIKRMVNIAYNHMFVDEPVVGAERVNDAVLRRIKEINNDSFFLFVNYMDAHEPYKFRRDYLPSETDLTSAPSTAWNLSALEPNQNSANIDEIQAIYDAAVRYVDEKFGKLVSELAMNGVLSDTYLIVCSDHGQMLGEGGFWGHGMYLHNALVQVPLVIVPPDGVDYSEQIHSTVSLADLPRTVLELTGNNFDDYEAHSLSGFPSSFDDHDPVPVLAEAYGPQRTVSDPVIDLSTKGYRKMYFGQWCVNHNLDTDEYETKQRINASEGQISRENALTELKAIESKLDLDAQTNEGPSSDVEQRLGDLGYM